MLTGAELTTGGGAWTSFLRNLNQRTTTITTTSKTLAMMYGVPLDPEDGSFEGMDTRGASGCGIENTLCPLFGGVASIQEPAL